MIPLAGITGVGRRSILLWHIYRASQRGDKLAVHSQQQLLIESEAARLLAVRHVTQDNEGKDTAGVDGVRSVTPKGRLALVSAIHPKHWNQQLPKPVLRVWIPKPGTVERRPRGILSSLSCNTNLTTASCLAPACHVKNDSQGRRPKNHILQNETRLQRSGWQTWGKRRGK